MNNLPRVVTQPRPGRESNSRPLDRKSDVLPLRHHATTVLLQVAAGMKADVTVEMYAIAAGVQGERGVGHIAHDIDITTETDHLRLPVTANILAFDIPSVCVWCAA